MAWLALFPEMWNKNSFQFSFPLSSSNNWIWGEYYFSGRLMSYRSSLQWKNCNQPPWFCLPNLHWWSYYGRLTFFFFFCFFFMEEHFCDFPIKIMLSIQCLCCSLGSCRHLFSLLTWYALVTLSQLVKLVSCKTLMNVLFRAGAWANSTEHKSVLHYIALCIILYSIVRNKINN